MKQQPGSDPRGRRIHTAARPRRAVGDFRGGYHENTRGSSTCGHVHVDSAVTVWRSRLPVLRAVPDQSQTLVQFRRAEDDDNEDGGVDVDDEDRGADDDGERSDIVAAEEPEGATLRTLSRLALNVFA
jgi:hypothetical protein